MHVWSHKLLFFCHFTNICWDTKVCNFTDFFNAFIYSQFNSIQTQNNLNLTYGGKDRSKAATQETNSWKYEQEFIVIKGICLFWHLHEAQASFSVLLTRSHLQFVACEHVKS